MEELVRQIDATPTKRSYLAIMADYDLKLSVCELIDNAIDSWHRRGKTSDLVIKIEIDEFQKVIRVEDNAGGIKETDLKVIISLGDSMSVPNEEIIGIFGVGSKRAAVALAQDITIASRYSNERTYKVRYNDAWLNNPDTWKVNVFKIADITPSTTIIELNKLRVDINEEIIQNLQNHLSFVYAKIIQLGRVKILVNQDEIYPKTFEDWSYPPDYSPKSYQGSVTVKSEKVHYEILCGLTKSLKVQEVADYDEFGVYFYCNDRLIERAVKTFEVGFGTGLAGKPHPNHQIVRVIVKLKGSSNLMPWNSSKSKITFDHIVFKEIQKNVVDANVCYCKIAKKFSGDRKEKVFQFKTGEVSIVKIPDKKVLKSYLPEIPITRRVRFEDAIKDNNQILSRTKPWIIGLYEGVVAVKAIQKLSLQEKNRLVLLILDSTLEIAFKDYLANETGNAYGDERLHKLFNNRIEVHKEMESRMGTSISEDEWKKINYYYKLRCDLVHKKASSPVSDTVIDDFLPLTERVLTILFGINFTV